MIEDKKQSPFEKINIPHIKDFDLIHRGKWANANLYKFDKSGQPMILKSFCFRSMWIRCTVGAFLTHRESTVLQRLSGIAGIPEQPARCSPTSISYRYMEGETLGSISKQHKKLPESYFLEAEKRKFWVLKGYSVPGFGKKRTVCKK